MKRLMDPAKTDIEDVLDVLWDFVPELTRDPAVPRAVNGNNPFDKRVRVTTIGGGSHFPLLIGEAKPALFGAAKEMKAAGAAQDSDGPINDWLEAIAHSSLSLCAAVPKALDDFEDKPCRAGTARMFPEQRLSINDPGMLAPKVMADAAAGT